MAQGTDPAGKVEGKKPPRFSLPIYLMHNAFLAQFLNSKRNLEKFFFSFRQISRTIRQNRTLSMVREKRVKTFTLVKSNKLRKWAYNDSKRFVQHPIVYETWRKLVAGDPPIQSRFVRLGKLRSNRRASIDSLPSWPERTTGDELSISGSDVSARIRRRTNGYRLTQIDKRPGVCVRLRRGWYEEKDSCNGGG